MEISGKDTNDEQLAKIPIILITLFVFHFEISGKNDNNLQPLNI